jgi:hypothetical protein
VHRLVTRLCAGHVKYSRDFPGTRFAESDIGVESPKRPPVEEGDTVETAAMSSRIDPSIEPAAPAVEVRQDAVRVHELSIERPSVIAYMQSIPAGKQSIAFVHALEVGITELVARRERFRA